MNTWQIQIKGVVQGVGFRPFVHKVAAELKVRGKVFNNSNGLIVSFNADTEKARIFYQRLISDAPDIALITAHGLKELDIQEFSEFTISDSKQLMLDDFRITPDLAMCEECRTEISDPNNRRFGYAFTTCTNCGPRYSILTSLPFDRENTSMSGFEMCVSCQKEYLDPNNSRHHSQTNSCQQCGLTLKLFDCNAQKYIFAPAFHKELIKVVSNQITRGTMVAIKGIGGYLLICDATNSKTLKLLRKRKHRPRKPLALMYPNIEAVQDDYQVSDQELLALQSQAAPIVLLQPKGRQEDRKSYDLINPGLERVGVMLPYAPLFELIMQQVKSPIVATSGNVSGSPIIHTNDIAIKSLSIIADYILTHNRDITFPQDDSVIQFTKSTQQRIILRRSRGYAPNYINPNLKIDQAATKISLGADLKNSFGLLHNQNILISQYLGDMGNYDVQKNAHKYIGRLKAMLDRPLDQVIVDRHPNYASGRLGYELAEKEQTPVLEVPHHLAHFCAILGEHNLIHTKERILGVIWDGTGFGDDGNIWGGEYFLFDQKQFSRVSHLKYFDSIAGDKISQEPRLSALAIGFGHTGVRDHLKKKFNREEWQIYTKQLRSGSRIKSSSIGRLFDVVASVLDVTDTNTFEAEAAMSLETLAGSYLYDATSSDIICYQVIDAQLQLDGTRLISEIFKDLIAGVERNKIAAKFYKTLVDWIEQMGHAQQAKKLAFSGGVFQNAVLVDLIADKLGKHFELFFHQDLSPNDENIAFGQLVYSSLGKHTWN